MCMCMANRTNIMDQFNGIQNHKLIWCDASVANGATANIDDNTNVKFNLIISRALIRFKSATMNT